MQIHQIKPANKSSKKRVGRGGKRGTYSGRGMKGQKSRSGRRFQPAIRQFIKRYHKLRGYRFNPFSDKPETINLDILEKRFQANELVSPEVLVKKGLARKHKGKTPLVKILSIGELKKPLQIKGCLFSKTAQKKIEKAGGKIEYVS